MHIKWAHCSICGNHVWHLDEACCTRLYQSQRNPTSIIQCEANQKFNLLAIFVQQHKVDWQTLCLETIPTPTFNNPQNGWLGERKSTLKPKSYDLNFEFPI